MHNRVVCSTCGNRMMLKYHICDVCYQATKHQTEKMLYEYREKTGNKFLVDEVKFEWKTQSKTKSIRQRKDGVEGDVMEFETPGFWEQPWFWDLMKQVLAGLVILVLVLGLLRPTLKSLSGGGRREREDDSGSGSYGGFDDAGDNDALRQAMEPQDDLLLPGAADSYDRQLNALKGLIAEDPARVSQVMRQWVNVDD